MEIQGFLWKNQRFSKDARKMPKAFSIALKDNFYIFRHEYFTEKPEAFPEILGKRSGVFRNM